MQTSNFTIQKSKGRPIRAALLIVLPLCILFFASLVIYTAVRLNSITADPLSEIENRLALTASKQSETEYLHTWEWTAFPSEPEPQAATIEKNIYARSAILVDAQTGAILLEKNADELIPPASMTKVVAMYTAFKAIESGLIQLDDTVDLPPESWAVNIPAGSSLMFLGKDQKVTVRELLAGMATVSGNDAAIAIAFYVSGSIEAFVDRMNSEIKMLGLTQTHFVEPSGLSEFNVTTAREFVQFAMHYINEYPEALTAFHSLTSFSYPKQENLPQGHSYPPVFQRSTNKLLETLEGCDGLKTGFIYESGYNFALTAHRKGTRFISVSMGGPGSNSREGIFFRNKDGENLMEWAFAHFKTIQGTHIESFPVLVWQGKRSAIRAIPAGKSIFTVPKSLITESSPVEIEIRVQSAPWITAPVHAGDSIGSIEYLYKGIVVHTIPLVADRNIEKAGSLQIGIDFLAEMIAGLALKK
ncbi:MAG TPA: D-alanyl-D-alanine carboxypeptidase family protein [Treponemataceae bacterium]|nr:D-alanyl-D-alanine carboxypeptidase family protein [Treponemataceae bacterium]